MTNDKFVKVGIIGVGTIGSAHAASIYNGAIDGMRLCALCDTSKERANALKELYPDIPIYTSDDEFFEKADVEAITASSASYEPSGPCRATRRGIVLKIDIANYYVIRIR